MLGRKVTFVAVATALFVACAALPAQAETWHDPRRHQDSHSWSQGSRHSFHYWWVGRNGSSDTSDDNSDDSSDNGSDNNSSDSTDSGSTDSSSTDVAPVAPATGGVGSAQTIQAELTGFSFQDNTPPGSATICCPKLHQKAGGVGTFADPTTTAVPGSGGSGMETPAGTRIYVAKAKRYFIVEDSGASPMGSKHFDLWVAGQGFSKSDSDACASDLTGKAPVIINPAAGLPVASGPLTKSGGCNI